MSKRTRAGQAYVVRFGAATALYTGLMFFAYGNADRFEAPWSYLLAMSPVLGVGVGAWALASFIRSIDEFQRSRQLWMLSFSIIVTILVCFAYGASEKVGAPHISMMLVPAVWAVGYGIAAAVAAIRDRDLS